MDRRAETLRATWPSRVDVVPAVVVLAIEVVTAIAASNHQSPRRGLDVLAFALLAAGPVALVWRRKAPAAVLGVVFGVTLASWTIGYPRGPNFIALIVAFGWAVVAGRRAAAWASLAAGYVTFLWLPPLVGTGDAPTVGALVGLAAWLLVLGTAAEIVRANRERLAERARSRVEERRRRESEERLRIARDLHDVVAHNLSLINVQSGVALHLIDQRPQQIPTALSAIRDASKEALDELRGVLQVLRADGEDLPRAPTPTLDDLPALVERTLAAGMDVHLETAGSAGALAPPVQTAAYRVVQEALTNVARHAGPARVVVRLCDEPGGLVVEVDDDGIGQRSRHGGGGTGLVGMRERVQAAGGQLEAGPKPGRGFRVRAHLPIGAE